MWRADRRLWLTKERDRVVEDGDPEAAFLLSAGEGDEIGADLVRKYGLSDRKAEEEVVDEDDDDEEEGDGTPRRRGRPRKQMEPEENKMMRSGENK